MVKRAAKRLAYIILGTLGLIILLALYTQTTLFKDQIRSLVVERLDSLFNAEVFVGRIEGNLLTSLSIDSAAIVVNGEHFMTVGRVEVEYDPIALWRNTIQIDRVSLINPEVQLLSDREGRWNFSKMIRPSPGDTSVPTPGPFAWNAFLTSLVIRNGSVRLTDSAALADPRHGPVDRRFVEYHDWRIHDLELDLSGEVRGSERQININNISFVADSPEFEVRRFAGEFTVSPAKATVKGMILHTKNSSVELNAAMQDIDLLGGIELASLQKCPIALTISNSDIDLEELGRFIPDIAFLGETVSTDLDVAGLFGEFDIKRLHLAVGSTSLHVRGTMYGLHRPSDLYLDVSFSESTVYSPDVHSVLQGLTLPDYEDLGVSNFALSFRGKPVDFQTSIAMRNTAGDLRAEIAMAIGGPKTLRYNGTTKFEKLNVASLISGGPESSLNGSVHIEGEGVRIGDITASAFLAVDSSTFLANPVGASRVTMNVAGEGVNGTLELAVGSLDATLSAKLDRLLSERPAFEIGGSVSSLNLSEFLHDTTYDSHITMRVDASGEGLHPEDVSGEFVADFLSSRYRDFQLDSGAVRLTIDQHDAANRSVRIESGIADFSLNGSFDIAYLLDLIRFEVDNLEAAAKERVAVFDPTVRADTSRAMIEEQRRSLSRKDVFLDARYQLVIKDLEPVSLLTRNRRFNGVGNLSGKFFGNLHKLSLRATLDAGELYYGDAESGFFVAGGKADVVVDNLTPGRDPLMDAYVSFSAAAPDIHLNLNEFDSLAVFVEMREGEVQYNTSGRFADDVGFSLDGTATISDEAVTLTPGECLIGFGPDRWLLDQGSTVSMGAGGLLFRNVVFRSDTQQIRLDGSVAPGGEVDASLKIDRISLGILETMMRREERSQNASLVRGTGSLSMVAGGTIADPDVHMLLEARDVFFRGLPFGELRAEAAYRTGVATLDCFVADDLGDHSLRPKLKVTGAVPLGEPRPGARKDVDLSIVSDGIQINFLDPLLPTFNDLTGILRCDLRITGPPEDVLYGGSFSLSDCAFLFEPNNIRYQFSGRFEPEGGDRIRVVEAIARNIPSDNRPGREGVIRFSGSFDLSDFVPTDFDLVAKGELLVVKPESRRSSLPIYGDLYVETGSSGLHFSGTLEKSFLRGDVLIRSSRLIFPATGEGKARESDYSIPIVVVDDTSSVPRDIRESFRDIYFNHSTPDAPAQGESVRKKSFLEGIEYDLNVETTGPSSEIKLVFSEIPVEELQANVQGKWSITGDGTRWIGDMDIERAYYSFFKQFDATGRLRYSGEFLNPELDITAQYQSTRTIQDPTDSTTITERVVVTLRITGTRSEPQHSMSMTIDDIDYYSYTGPKSSDIESDAIAFILAGAFPLSRSESSVVAADLQTSVGASMVVGASSLLTKELSDYLRRETGFITSVEFGYGSQASFREAADIRLSGTAFRGYWRYRGTILDNPFNNSNVTLLYSFGEIFNRPSLRNLMLELERSTEAGTTGLIDDRKEINSARLFYRFSF